MIIAKFKKIVLNFINSRETAWSWVVRALGLHVVAPGSNPIFTSGLDLFVVVLDSTLPRFVNSQLVASCQLGF